MSSLTRQAIASILLMSSSGCYTWQPIKPTELPKLNADASMLATTAGGEERVRMVPGRRTVETPDGSLAEIKRKFDARIELKDDRVFDFEHPVRAQINPEQLIVAGGNSGARTFDLHNVAAVEVRELDVGQTVTVAVVGGVVGTVVLTLLFLSLVPHGASY